MQDYTRARKAFKIIKEQVINSKFFVGIEIASYQKDGIYTNNVCIRVLVNSKKMTHKKLKISDCIDGIPVVIAYRLIHLF